MTSFKPLEELLKTTDFAEIAKEHKKQLLIAQKKEQEEEAERQRIKALPKITEDDITQAEKIAFEKGLVAGKNAAKEELKEEFDAQLGEMRRKIEDISPIIREQLALMQKSTLAFIKKVLQHSIGHASEHYSEEILDFSLHQILEKSNLEAKLTLTFAPSNRFYFEKQGKDKLKGLNVALVEDENLNAGDCLITWNNSGVDARIANISKEIDAIIEAASSGIKVENIDFEFLHEKKEALEQSEPLEEASTENKEEREALPAEEEKTHKKEAVPNEDPSEAQEVCNEATTPEETELQSESEEEPSPEKNEDAANTEEKEEETQA